MFISSMSSFLSKNQSNFIWPYSPEASSEVISGGALVSTMKTLFPMICVPVLPSKSLASNLNEPTSSSIVEEITRNPSHEFSEP